MNNGHLLHGIFVSDGGKGTIGTLSPLLEELGLNPVPHSYGKIGFITALWKNKKIAEELALRVQDGDVGLGHSNAAPILVRAAQNGANFSVLVLIQAALKKDIVFPPNIKHILVIHNYEDDPVVAAKWYRRLVFWRPNFLWGEMGNTGYTGSDPRVVNVRMFKDHSNVFLPKNRTKLYNTVRKYLTKWKKA